jgi:hypothetical protein
MIWNGVCRGASPRKSSHDIWIQLMRLASEKKFFQSGFELLRFALVLVGICHFRPLASGTVLLRNLTDLPAELSGRPPDCEYSWRIHRHCCSMATQGENLLRAFPSIRPESSAAVRRSPSVLDYLMESGRCSRSRRNRAAHELDRRTARKTASTSPASAPASTRNRDGSDHDLDRGRANLLRGFIRLPRFYTHPKNASRRPTAWLAISDSNFDVQRENSSL